MFFFSFFFFFNYPATTEIYTLSLHDALPIFDNPDTTVAEGERGELAVRGPQVMAGYWNNPEATATTIRNGWLMTGDVGHRDEDGYLFLTDRLKDVIFCSGYKVYPRVIEDAFYRHADVDEVIVIGIPDDYRGETPKAYVKLKGGASANEAELLGFVEKILNPIEIGRAHV
mgnify:CR=1 FL=1